MTSEELKQTIPMHQVVKQYGIKIDRKGFCRCPFHNEKTGSMKIYKDSYHCFGCHANGDIFTFVQRIDNCDFKTAFISLGGTYETMSDKERNRANTKRERAYKERTKQEKVEAAIKEEISYCLELCKHGVNVLEPFSDEWCFCTNNLQILENVWEEKYEKGEEINETNVYRICRQIRRYFHP